MINRGKIPDIDKKFIRNTFIVFLIIEFLTYLIISSIPFTDPTMYGRFKKEQGSIISQPIYIIFFDIFINNFKVASLEVIPVIGIFFFFASAISTSLVISLEGGAHNISGFFIILTLLFFPHTWLELPSYAIAVSIGVYLFYSLIKFKDGKELLLERLFKFLILYGFVALELAVAAIFEATEIYFETTQPSPNNLLYPILMWIPAVPALIILVKIFHKANTRTPFRKKEIKPEINEWEIKI
ncbi:MAG: stage II sporulation protein M [Thermoplasmataceae archaeon]